MSITAPTPTATRPARDTMRRTSLTAGVLYLITFVSMPTLALYQGVHDRADFILGAGSDTGVLWGALSEVVVAIAGIGTAVVLFPVAKRQSETAALGFVASRIVEGCLIIVGGVIDRTAPINALAALPIALWEFSIGVYMTFKGFRPSSPLLTPPPRAAGIPSAVPSPRSSDEQHTERGAAVS